MTRDQASIAVPLLNSYAHQYLGLPEAAVMVAGGLGPDGWILIVAVAGSTFPVTNFDDAKEIIDSVRVDGA